MARWESNAFSYGRFTRDNGRMESSTEQVCILGNKKLRSKEYGKKVKE